jgi:hypothetical protein
VEMRGYVTSDGPAVWELHKAALASTGADRGDGPWDDDLRDITRSYVRAEGAFLVVTDEGTLVAMGGMRQADDPHTAGSVYVIFLVFLPSRPPAATVSQARCLLPRY